MVPIRGFDGKRRIAAAALLTLIATVANAGGPSEYTITVDESLTELRVRAQIDAAATAVRASGRGWSNRISNLSYCDGAGLRVRRGRVSLDPLRSNCLVYAVSLRHGKVGRTRGELPPSSHYRALSPSEWLLLPDLTNGADVTVRLELPAGMTASVPWVPLGESADHLYRVPRSPRSASATVVFGKFPQENIPIPGSRLRTAFFGVSGAAEIAKLSEWLRHAAANVTLGVGRFPNPSPQVIVINTPRYGSSPVTFGRVVRNGGEAITYYVNADARDRRVARGLDRDPRVFASFAAVRRRKMGLGGIRHLSPEYPAGAGGGVQRRKGVGEATCRVRPRPISRYRTCRRWMRVADISAAQG